MPIPVALGALIGGASVAQGALGLLGGKRRRKAERRAARDRIQAIREQLELLGISQAKEGRGLATFSALGGLSGPLARQRMAELQRIQQLQRAGVERGLTGAQRDYSGLKRAQSFGLGQQIAGGIGSLGAGLAGLGLFDPAQGPVGGGATAGQGVGFDLSDWIKLQQAAASGGLGIGGGF